MRSVAACFLAFCLAVGAGLPSAWSAEQQGFWSALKSKTKKAVSKVTQAKSRPIDEEEDMPPLTVRTAFPPKVSVAVPSPVVTTPAVPKLPEVPKAPPSIPKAPTVPVIPKAPELPLKAQASITTQQAEAPAPQKPKRRGIKPQ